jgi:3-isopropylmalate/(R)-2-methylmalate dehydratase small subunit
MKPFDRLEGIAAPLPMANVDTDKIVPSRFLKTISKAGLGDALFADLRKDPDFVLNQAGRAEARILVALDNFGCGSSREHAPWALEAYGFRCVIAPSFAEIFQNNCRNNAILTITLEKGEVDSLISIISDPAHCVLSVDLPDQVITTSTGETFAFDIAPSHKRFLLNGENEIDRTMALDTTIDEYEASQRARRPWLATALVVEL